MVCDNQTAINIFKRGGGHGPFSNYDYESSYVKWHKVVFVDYFFFKLNDLVKSTITNNFELNWSKWTIIYSQ